MDKLIKEIDEYISTANNLVYRMQKFGKSDIKKNINSYADLLLACMACVDNGYSVFFRLKTQFRYPNTKKLVNFDYSLSKNAGFCYSFADDLIKIVLDTNYDLKDVFGEHVQQFIQLIQVMLNRAARFDIERMINRYELNTDPSQRAFPRRKPLLKTVIFFANLMNAKKLGVELGGNIQPKRIIFSVMPSSGKSLVVNVYSVMSLLLHLIYYRTSGIIRMTNTSTNAEIFSSQILGMIRNPVTAEIYPEISEYYKDNKCTIFEKESISDWKFKNLDPRIGGSMFARGRESAINSLRIFVALIIDDLSDGVSQMNADEDHKKMFGKYVMDMESRKEDDTLPEFIVGTMFNEFDVPNQLIGILEKKGELVDDKVFPNVRHSKDYNTVVITMDCFDSKGESIAPDLISTEKLLEKQQVLKSYEFDLVYRQLRASREPRLFDYNNLITYAKTSNDELSAETYSVLDPTRKSGSDFFVLPACKKNLTTGNFRLVDVICKQKSLGNISDPNNRFLDEVVNFIIKNNIVELVVENNTSNTIGTLLIMKLEAKNYFKCKIKEEFSASRKGEGSKQEKILNQEPTIVEHIEFPAYGSVPPKSDLYVFMDLLTHFDAKAVGKKGNYDDPPDAMAMFAKHYLYNTRSRISEIKPVNKFSIFN